MCSGDLPRIRQAFREESMSCTRQSILIDTEQGENGEEKVISMLIIFFDSKGIVSSGSGTESTQPREYN
jgi:hypothetical protein